MTVGVTGSAGFLGANLLRRLHAAGGRDLRLLGFYSRRVGNPLTEALGLGGAHLDVTDREEVLRRTRGLDVLFHLAGLVDYSRGARRRSWEVNVLGAKNVFDAALANRIGRLVFVSSISVLGPPPGPGCLADEGNDPYAAPENPISFRCPEQALEAVRDSLRGRWGFLEAVRVPYFDSKLAAYELAREYRSRHGLAATVVLPGTAVGAGDVAFSISRLVSMVYRGRLRFSLPGGTSFVAASDVAEGLRLAWVRGRPGESYIVTGETGDNLSYAQFMRRVALVSRRDYGRRAPRRFLPLPRALSGAVARAARLLPPGAPLSEGLVLAGSLSHRFSHAKAGRELGYQPACGLEGAIRECIDFYLRYQATEERP